MANSRVSSGGYITVTRVDVSVGWLVFGKQSFEINVSTDCLKRFILRTLTRF